MSRSFERKLFRNKVNDARAALKKKPRKILMYLSEEQDEHGRYFVLPDCSRLYIEQTTVELLNQLNSNNLKDEPEEKMKGKQ